MTQQEFNNLSKRYLESKATEEETTYLMDWYQRQPLSAGSNLTTEQKNTLEKRMWKRIRNQMPTQWHAITVRTAWFSGLAACLALCFFWVNGKLSTITSEPLAVRQVPGQVGIEIKNTAPSEQEVKLEDGTVLLLKQNSSILYDKSFNKTKREVYLKGEAFFKVKRDVTKPFVVHTGELVTEVLGTSFRIKSHTRANEIEVAVTTGRVSVYTEKPGRRAERNGVILTPNQRVTFDTQSKNIIPSIVDVPIPIRSAEAVAQPLIFQNTSLEDVLQALSQLYGIEFVIANPNAKNCRITADLKGLSLFTQLDLVCKSIDATYQKRGTVVFINSDGC